MKIIKSLIIFACMLITQSAFADCWSNANQIPPGTPPLFLVNGQWCTTQAQGAQSFQQVVLPVNAIQVPSGTPAPQGYCSWGERFMNVGASAVVGGLIGVLATDTSRGTGQGAALGAAAGVFIPCTQTNQVVQQPRNIANQGVLPGQSAGLSTSGVACSTGGKTFLVSSIEECTRRAMEIAQAATPQTVTGTVVGIPPSCVVSSKTEKFRFNAVKGVKINREQCDRYVKEVDPLPSKEDMSIVM